MSDRDGRVILRDGVLDPLMDAAARYENAIMHLDPEDAVLALRDLINETIYNYDRLVTAFREASKVQHCGNPDCPIHGPLPNNFNQPEA